jgi:integrase
MPRRAAGLTAAKVRTAAPGRYGDGNGLYLLVRSPDARFWVFRYTIAGRMREMGLGRAGADAAAVPLAEARTKAAELHRLVRAGADPLQQREAAAVAAKAAEQEAAIRAVTFRAVAEFYLAAHEAGWRNPKHRDQWRNTLETYAHPRVGVLPVSDVDTAHVLAMLEPIWREKPETAARLRGRLEAVLDYARVRGWRQGENPARWRGHLDHLLPSRAKVAPVEHHAALPWAKIGGFLAQLRHQPGVAARALEFAILTAARTSETLGATWVEIDVAGKIWTVPAGRMKAGREHRVPLSDAALAVLHSMAALRTKDDPAAYVFPGARDRKPLSIMAMAMLLRRMDRDDLTVHGFRSTFRDWAAEATGYPREIAEAALAHSLPDKVEAAYRRSDLFDKRRRLMDAWAGFCAKRKPTSGEVPPIRHAAE